MDLLLNLGILVGSLILLVKGSDWFVDAGETIGLSFGISPFIIGVTIIAFGTSLPELASSIAAIYADESSIVIANVVGSNITNITLILGLVSVIGGTIVFKKDVMNTDMPLLLLSSAFLWFVVSDLDLSISDAIILLLGLLVFLFYSFRGSEEEASEEARPKANWQAYAILVGGGLAVYFGADWTVYSIQAISDIAQINPDVIAVTMIALGTSLPELMVSITAARRGRTEIAVGNVIGSNIFNTYAVMSIPRFFGPLVIPPEFLGFHLPFMIVATIAFAIMSISKKISNWEGMMLLLLYIFFVMELLRKVI